MSRSDTQKSPKFSVTSNSVGKGRKRRKWQTFAALLNLLSSFRVATQQGYDDKLPISFADIWAAIWPLWTRSAGLAASKKNWLPKTQRIRDESSGKQ